MRVLNKKKLLYNMWVCGLSICCFFFFASFAQPMGRLVLHMKSESLHNGIKNRVEADIYYAVDEGKMVTHYTYPRNYIRLSNSLGEVKMYFPDENSVVMTQDGAFSSENDVLHFFLYNKTTDLGLTGLGYKLLETRMDDGLLVTEWEPIVYESEEIKKVVMAHEDNLPVYTGYFKVRDKVARKVYYSDFEIAGNGIIPTTITEIMYFPKGDSVVNRKQFSNIQSGVHLQNAYFRFEIPADAKRIEGLGVSK
jgi:hypothetical protein